jgi:hypothetical protein
VSRPFTASYGGRCAADCGDPIRPGDTVEYLGDELMHEDCADDGPSDRATEARYRTRADTPCPACNLVHAGECW